MIFDILGWIWIVTGALFFWKPEWLRGRLLRKGKRKARGILFMAALVVGGIIIKAAWGVPGLLGKIALVIGIIAIVKAFFFLNAKSAEHLLGWFEKQPVQYLRGYAVLQIAVGFFFLLVK